MPRFVMSIQVAQDQGVGCGEEVGDVGFVASVAAGDGRDVQVCDGQVSYFNRQAFDLFVCQLCGHSVENDGLVDVGGEAAAVVLPVIPYTGEAW